MKNKAEVGFFLTMYVGVLFGLAAMFYALFLLKT
jgi:hypothetical protein